MGEVKVGIPEEVVLPLECVNCGHRVLCYIQFKFGGGIEKTYALGDAIDWSGPDLSGKPGSKMVVANGIGCSCPVCHEDPAGTSEFKILIERDVITSAIPNFSREHLMGADWVVLED